MLRAAVTAFAGSDLTRIDERVGVRGGLTLTPQKPVMLRCST